MALKRINKVGVLISRALHPYFRSTALCGHVLLPRVPDTPRSFDTVLIFHFYRN
jgi:hypothetical protein